MSSAMAEFRQTPQDTGGMPSGVPFIVGNELAERFSYYGMSTILVVFMTHHLKDASGALAPMSPEQAKAAFHTFVAGAYFFPMLGAIISDVWLGKYRTIMYLSLGYCFGHAVLASNETRFGLLLGLSSIALGAGGIKPCVSANVGDQFGKRNQHLLERIYNWFYFSINIGSFFSTLLTPWLLEHVGPSVAFGVPGILMAVATLVFWIGRHHFAHIPPAGASFVRELTSPGGRALVGKLFGLVLFIAVFWALYYQNASAWVLQAEKMDRTFLGITWLSSQVQAVNPILVLVLIPTCSYWLYPAISRVFVLTALRKIGIGFFLMTATFLISAFIETRLAAGVRMNIAWQIFAYALLTLAEVMVYGTGLEFFYSQAPNRMKSFIMGLFFISLSLGNAFTAVVNVVIQNPDGTAKLSGAPYYLAFAGMMFVTALGFIAFARRYREQRHIQGSDDGDGDGTRPAENEAEPEVVGA
jgi:POT family proton-dependent oligopeptide transporter